MYFLEKLNRRNSLIAKISLTAKLLQEQFANSELEAKFSAFPKSCQFVPRVCRWLLGVVFAVFYAIQTLYDIK